MKKIILFLAICIGIPFLLLKCMGAANSAEPIKINGAYANPTMGNLKVGAAFLSITNNGKADAIIGAESPIAARVELHAHTSENGIMRMRQMEEIALPAGQTVKLQPGGLHIMLFDLKQPLKLKESFPLVLKTKSGLKISTTVNVEDRE